MTHPIVAIVGRPNVGKSTLFNRLAGKKLALVHDRPGVTRDRREAEAALGDLAFTLVDTAGFEEAEAGGLEDRMRKQTEAALAGADIAIFVIDARAGVTAADEIFAQVLRRAGKPVVLVANKCETEKLAAGASEAYQLGFGEPLPLSAEHGLGLDLLYEALAAHRPKTEEEAPDPTEAPPLRIAVVGRPNAGKSSLLNRLIGEERFVTGPEAGITRDSVAVEWEWKGRHVRLVDTAGLRKKARVVDALEQLSTADSLRALRFAEVVILVVDAEEPFEKQDLVLADLVIREGRALVIVINKWDRIREREAAKRGLRQSIDDLLPQAKGVPLVFVSALTGEGMEKLMPAVAEAHERWNFRVPTAALNRWLEATLARHPPPLVKGRRLKFRYATQPKTRPPGFVLFTSRPADVPDDYQRYLANSLRESFGLDGVPLRLLLRKGKNPYADGE